MKKMRKVLSLLLVMTMVLAGLSACNKKTDANGETSNAPTEVQTVPTLEDYGTGTIKIWVAENAVAFTKTQCDAFFAAHPEMNGYQVDIQPVGEGDATNNMVTDVLAGADIFGFAQDQLARLVAASAIMDLPGAYAQFVDEANDAGAAAAAKVGDTTYAFPLTSDNGYFLYYDKSVITDPTSLEKIVADCEAAGKNFYFEINSGWYQTAFFFGTGANIEYSYDKDGNVTGCTTDYASDKGVKALKAIIELAKSPAFQNGSSAGNATNMAALVDGMWDFETVQGMLGDNLGCVKLPTFTVDGETYQLSGFGGFKLLGVKPQEETGKALVCLELAKFLTDEQAQIARYEAIKWGPSNKVAQANPAVTSNIALKALAEQLAFTKPQGNYPNDYWKMATGLGDDVIADALDNKTDAELMDVLKNLEDDFKAAK